MCTCDYSDSVLWKHTGLQCMNWQYTLHVLCMPLKAVQVSSARAQCTGRCSDSVCCLYTAFILHIVAYTYMIHFQRSVLHTHHVCKICELWIAHTHRRVHIAPLAHFAHAWNGPRGTKSPRDTFLCWNFAAASAQQCVSGVKHCVRGILLCLKMVYFNIFRAQQCTKSALYGWSSEQRRHAGRLLSLLSGMGRMVRAWVIPSLFGPQMRKARSLMNDAVPASVLGFPNHCHHTLTYSQWNGLHRCLRGLYAATTNAMTHHYQ